MFKFALIECSYLHKEQYWFLLIENIIDLCHYFETIDERFVRAYFELKKKIKKGYHISNNEEMAVWGALLNKPSKNLVTDIQIISDTMKKPKISAILKGNKLLINSTNVGWCIYSSKSHKILKTVKRNKLIPPEIKESDIHITKWENGKHYYLRIGGHDFGKFATIKEAERVSKIEFNKLTLIK